VVAVPIAELVVPEQEDIEFRVEEWLVALLVAL
jgi:hypothetical protein